MLLNVVTVGYSLLILGKRENRYKICCFERSRLHQNVQKCKLSSYFARYASALCLVLLSQEMDAEFHCSAEVLSYRLNKHLSDYIPCRVHVLQSHWNVVSSRTCSLVATRNCGEKNCLFLRSFLASFDSLKKMRERLVYCESGVTSVSQGM